MRPVQQQPHRHPATRPQGTGTGLGAHVSKIFHNWPLQIHIQTILNMAGCWPSCLLARDDQPCRPRQKEGVGARKSRLQGVYWILKHCPFLMPPCHLLRRSSLAECGSDSQLWGLTRVPQCPRVSRWRAHPGGMPYRAGGVALRSANESPGDVADADPMGLGPGL